MTKVLTHRDLRTFKGHSGDVWCVAWSPDGKQVVSASNDGTVKVWDSVSGKEIATLTDHEAVPIKTAIFSPDGKYLLSGGQDNVIRVRDSRTLEPRASLAGHAHWIRELKISSDSRWLVSASADHTAKIWDLHQVVQPSIFSNVRWPSFSFFPDGTRLAVGGIDGRLQIWDLAQSKVIVSTGEHNIILDVAVNSDGTRAASCDQGKVIRLWNTSTGELEKTFESSRGWVNKVTFLPKGTLLAAGTKDNTLPIWNWKTGELIARPTGLGWVFGVDFSADGNLIAIGDNGGLTRLWEVESRQFLGHVDRRGPVTDV